MDVTVCHMHAATAVSDKGQFLGAAPLADSLCIQRATLLPSSPLLLSLVQYLQLVQSTKLPSLKQHFVRAVTMEEGPAPQTYSSARPSQQGSGVSQLSNNPLTGLYCTCQHYRSLFLSLRFNFCQYLHTKSKPNHYRANQTTKKWSKTPKKYHQL